jgi:putative membrane protein
MRRSLSLLIGRLAAAILGLYLAATFIPRVSFEENYSQLFLAGGFLGILNLTLIPLLKLFTTPLRILSLGFLGLLIDLIFVWSLPLFFPSLSIPLIFPLLLTTLLISLLNYLFYPSK